MGILSLINKKKKQFYEYRTKAKEQHLKRTMERNEALKKEYEVSKKIIENDKLEKQYNTTRKEAQRIQHPLLFKISDNIKQNFQKSHNQKTNTKFFNNNKNDNVPYWLKQNKTSSNSAPYWLKNSSSSNSPYWLKQDKPQKKGGKSITIRLR